MIKRIYTLVTVASLFAMTSGPASAGNVTTGLTRDTSGGSAPIVKAKWEAYGATNKGTGTPLPVTGYYTDEQTTAGAQFVPSGIKDTNTNIALCSVVTDPDGLADVTTAPGAVYGDVFYPEGIALGSSHVPLPGQSGLACGNLMQEDKLIQLSKADGIELFCNQVRNNNNNLATFASGYNYDEICKTDGELQKETAAVYCVTKDLSYEDTAGDYKVWSVVQDKVGLQGRLENQFTYLPLTAFETDFTSVGYGNVRLATDKIISGDLTWDAVNQGKASVRNVGNTRLSMKVQQDDMGFGKTNGLWNVRYDARVGSNATWAHYDPDTLTQLLNPLNLSQLDEMDFSIYVSKFPPTHVGDTYTGTMTLSAASEPPLACATAP